MDLKVIQSLQRGFHHTKSRHLLTMSLQQKLYRPTVEDGTIEEDSEDADQMLMVKMSLMITVRSGKIMKTIVSWMQLIVDVE